MLDEKIKKGKCPFRKMKLCSEECVLYRKGVRVKELTDETYPIEICAINVIADNIEQVHNRQYMTQKEMGDLKNITAFKILSDFQLVHQNEVIRRAKQTIEEGGEIIDLLPEGAEKKLLNEK